MKLAVLRHRFWSVVTGADIPLNAGGIGGGLLLPHPNGVVIHPEAHIGPNCLLFQQVTIGTGSTPGTPRIGGHVDVGAGAKILGGVVIGDHAVIGANAVVVTDVPAWSVAVGVPAVARRRDHGVEDDESAATPSSRRRAIF
jgi:serine O-acetyltransferase